MKKLTMTLTLNVEDNDGGRALIGMLVDEVESGSLVESFKEDEYILEATATAVVEDI